MGAMPFVAFAYYARLSRKQKAIYRRSDTVNSVRLRGARSIQPLAGELRLALESEDRGRIEHHARRLATAVLADLDLGPVGVKVLPVRPTRSWGELHGLYEQLEGTPPARITLWMRTARHKRVVAFRTFLRTLLHELCHHLDYELLALEDSFHTEGFFQRESSLLHQVLDA